jgi:hypothetical protein
MMHLYVISKDFICIIAVSLKNLGVKAKKNYKLLVHGKPFHPCLILGGSSCSLTNWVLVKQANG